jgi:transcriptional regulator with XRE-family HTH domain
MADEAIELRKLMQLAGLTFRALGEKIGVDQARVFKALSGEITVRPEVMKAMESAIVQAARDRASRLAAVLGVVTPAEPKTIAKSGSIAGDHLNQTRSFNLAAPNEDRTLSASL